MLRFVLKPLMLSPHHSVRMALSAPIGGCFSGATVLGLCHRGIGIVALMRRVRAAIREGAIDASGITDW